MTTIGFDPVAEEHGHRGPDDPIGVVLEPVDLDESLFLSFTTLSSTGLSDVVPIQPFARSLVMIEQLAGLGYVAMIVSRVVGLTIMRRPDD